MIHGVVGLDKVNKGVKGHLGIKARGASELKFGAVEFQ